MRRFVLCAALAGAILASSSSAAIPEITSKDIEVFVRPSAQDHMFAGSLRVPQWHPILLAKWENDARAALGDNDVPHAARFLADKYGLSPDEMAQLLKLWVLSKTHQFPYGETGARVHHEMDLAWIRLAADSDYKPLVLQAMTVSVGDYSFSCDPKLLDQLLDEAPDKVAVGWQVVRQRNCRDWLHWLLEHVGERKYAALLDVTRDINESAEDKLAILAWLTREDGRSHVDPKDRAAVRMNLTHDYAIELWQSGLTEDGLAAIDSLSSEARGALLAGDLEERTAMADGLTFDLGGTKAEDFRLDYAAALFKDGRREEAQRVFARVKSLASAEKYLTCHPGQAQLSMGDPCGDPNPNFSKALLLDALLRNSGDKLGAAAQTFFSNSWFMPQGLLWTELTCHAFNPRFPKVCQDARQMNAGYSPDEVDRPDALSATVAARDLPAFDASRKQFRTRIIAKLERQAPEPLPQTADKCAAEYPVFFGGTPKWGPGQSGKPMSYRDPQSGITFYVESDGRHVAALRPDGVLLWVRNPFEDSGMCPYRTQRPVIVAIEPSNPAMDEMVERAFKRKTRAIGIRFDSSQFGIADIDTGDFIFMGQN